MNSSKGFTLLELMIAILIFAMVSTAAYRLLASVTRSNEVSASSLQILDDVQRVQVILETDFMQMASRSIRNDFGDREPALLASARSAFLIEFTRSGCKQKANSAKSALQRVAYALENKTLVRYYWLELDRAPESSLIKQRLLTGVENIRFRYLDQKRNWRSFWPQERLEYSGKNTQGQDVQKDNVLPAGIEVMIEHDLLGVLEFMVPLVTVESDQHSVVPGADQQQNNMRKSRGINELNNEIINGYATDDDDDDDDIEDEDDDSDDDLEEDFGY